MLSSHRFLLTHQLLYHSVEEDLGFSAYSAPHGGLYSDGVVACPPLLVSLGSLNYGQDLGRLHLFAFPWIGDDSLGVGVLVDEGKACSLLLPRGGLSEHVEFEYNIAVGCADHRWVLAFLQGLCLHCIRQQAVLNLIQFEFHIFNLAFWLRLSLSGDPHVPHNFSHNGLLLFDGLKTKLIFVWQNGVDPTYL